MLDWQNKKWIKVIAVILIITFISYDIAWATDFSPIYKLNTASFNILPKITNFISQKILRLPDKPKKTEDTEISFRSQLIPEKKYGERSGFLRLETVKEMIKRQLDEMQNRQRVEEDRYNRKVMDYNVDAQQKMNNAEKGQESQSITEQAAKARGEIMGAAASVSEFSYVMNKDGSRVNYIDGLPSSILDERVIDMWGGVSLKDTWNMTYKDRFLISYEAAIKDPAGNITKISWFGAEYSPDSVWWASEDSAAGKYLLRYSEIITDPYGTVTTREWSATRENYGSDKKLDGYHEVVKDASGGIILESDRSNIQYDGDK